MGQPQTSTLDSLRLLHVHAAMRVLDCTRWPILVPSTDLGAIRAGDEYGASSLRLYEPILIVTEECESENTSAIITHCSAVGLAFGKKFTEEEKLAVSWSGQTHQLVL